MTQSASRSRKKQNQAKGNDAWFAPPILDNAPMLIALATTDGCVTFINRACEEIIGLSCEQVRDKSVRALSSELAFVQPINQALEAMAAGQPLPLFESDYVAADGRRVHLAWACTLIPDEHGHSAYILATALDVSEKHALSTKLVESEARFQAIFAASPDALFIETLNGNILDCNESACQMFGYERDELLSLNVAALLPDETIAKLPAVITEELTTGGIFIEALNKRKTGEAFPCLVSSRLVTVGEQQLVIAQVRDLSERDAILQASRQSESRFRSMAENIQDGLTIIEQGRVVYVNDRLCQILGRPAETLLATNVLDFAVPEERQRLAEIIENARKNRQLLDCLEFEIVHPNGERRYIRNRYAYNCQGNEIIGRFIVTTDITGQKATEAALRRQALTFETMFDGVIWTDADGLITDWNPAAERMSGYSKAEVLGKSPEILHCPADRPHLQQQIRAGVLRDGRWEGEVRFVRKDGSQGWLDLIVAAVKDEKGRLVATLGVNRDITARKEAESALQRREAILEAVSFAAACFLKTSAWENNIQEVMARLGNAAQISRVYLFQNYLSEEGQLFCRQRYEWVATGVTPQIDNEALQAVPYYASGFGRWAETLSQNQVICGLVKDFPLSERSLLQGQDILSLLVVPIFLQNSWWGFIGFDDCEHPRQWLPAEIDALRAAANTLEAAILNHLNEQVRLATIQISEAAHSAQTLDEIFRAIHAIISRLMPADNFYIALYDEASNSLSFPYFVDQVDEAVSHQPFGKGLTEYVIRTGQPLLASPEVFEALLQQGEVEEVGAPSIDWLGVPLQTNGRAFGVLVVQSYTHNVRFGEAEKEILMFVSTQVAMAVERKQVEQALRRRLMEVTVLQAVAVAGAEAASEDELIERVTRIVGDTFFPDNFGVFLLDSEAQLLRFHPSYRGLTPEYLDFVIPVGRGVTGTVAATGQPLCIADVSQCPQYIGLFFQAKSELCVPLKVGERVLGVINAESVHPANFSSDDERLLSTLANQLATAIERKRAQEAQRASEALYRTLVETSPDAIMLTSLDGKIVLCNQHTAVLSGVGDVGKLIGQNAFDLIAAEDQPKLRETLCSLDDLLATHYGEYTALRADGSRFPLEINVRVLPDTQGRPAMLLGVARDITTRRQREREREAIITFAASIRTAESRLETVSAILENMLALLNADGVALVRADLSEQRLVIESARGVWVRTSGLSLTSEQSTRRVLESGQPFVANAEQDSAPLPLALTHSAVCIPLIAQGQPLGVVWVGRSTPISADDIRLLMAIGDMAANALQRAALYEETQRRLRRLSALRTVDMAITSSLDLQVALSVLLDQITLQLNVDACDILLFNPVTQRLEYAASRGFRTYAITQTRFKLNETVTGQAILERRMLKIPNLFDGYQHLLQQRGLTCEAFVAYYAQPLLAKGQIQGVLEVFHRSPLVADAEWLDFFETLGGQAAIAVDNATLFTELQRTNVELQLAYDTTLEGWVRMLDLRDQETEGHTQRVTEKTLILARAIGIPESELVHIRRGALLHDIGKMAVPDAILRKPADLSADEWAIMRKHPLYAYELLWPITYLRPALDIPYCHHEKWDGTGYPRGLRGEQIPLAARIFSVVDVWDALRHDRPYRKGWDAAKIKEYLLSQSGTIFDPRVVSEFLRLLETEEN